MKKKNKFDIFISVIIINYFNKDFLYLLLEDLINNSFIAEILIIDNSGDIDYSLDRKSSKIKIIKPGKNLGFGAGVNLATLKASSKYLLVINPDVRLFPDCLYHLLEAAEKYGSVLTGPRFFWDEAKKYRLPPSQGATSCLDYAFEASYTNRLEFEHISFYWQMRHERFWSSTTPFTELFLSGACVLINREWAINNNLSSVFDERFFLYFEDNDISLRAYFDGIPPLCVPAAEAVHHYDQSPSPEQSKLTLMQNSHCQFAEKYYGSIKYSMNKIYKIVNYSPEISDIGQIISPFSCDLQLLHSNKFGNFCKTYFEIGVNPFFVPFAQTEMIVSRNTVIFKIDDSIWNKLAKGIYYTRIRDSIKGVLKIWKWEKV